MSGSLGGGAGGNGGAAETAKRPPTDDRLIGRALPPDPATASEAPARIVTLRAVVCAESDVEAEAMAGILQVLLRSVDGVLSVEAMTQRLWR